MTSPPTPPRVGLSTHASLWAPLAVLLCASVSMGCDAPESPVVVIAVRTDYVPALEFARVRSEIVGGTGSFGVFAVHDSAPSEDYIEGVAVGEFDGLGTGELAVRIDLLRADGTVLASRPALVDFRGSASFTLLLSRSCADVSCPGPGDPAASSACVAGRCVDAGCRTGEEESCGPPQCSEAAACASGAACAVAVCRSGACLLTTGADACSEDTVCHPESGCVATAGDGGMACPAPCDPVLPQCGCEAGLHCALGEDGIPECSSPPAPAPGIGEDCDGPASCDAGLVCVARPTTELCVQLCRGDADCAAGECYRVIHNQAGAPTPFRTCTMPCSPLVGDTTCPNGTRCVLIVRDDVFPAHTVADCDGPVGIRLAGEPCGDFTHCARGHACVDDVCRLLCDLATATCPEGLTCIPRPNLSADVGDYGVCE